MVSALGGLRSERSGFDFWPGTLCCVVGETLCSRSAFLHPGVQMGTGEFNAGGSPAMDYKLQTQTPAGILSIKISFFAEVTGETSRFY